jgi:hypothetical protein
MSEAEVEALLLRAEPNAGEVLARLRFGESEIVVEIPELRADDYPEMPKTA